jgi:peptidoglycan-N-acetylglucosamine deacetylase
LSAGVLALLYLGLRPPIAVVRLVARCVPSVLFCAATRERVVALTLDDGPDPVVTPRILDVLARRGARATFFVIGERAQRHTSLLHRIAREGHELANHTWQDQPSVLLDPAEFERSLQRTDRVISVVGSARWFRPGSGWVSPGMIAMARAHGYRCVLGSVYPQDAIISWKWWLCEDVVRRIHPGAIIIMHEGRPERAHVVDALDEVLKRLAGLGYSIVSVSELVHQAGSSRDRDVRGGVPPRRRH